MKKVTINTDEIYDWESFHDVFAKAFGFPEYYGRNMDAWIDCLTTMDDSPSQAENISLAAGEVLTLELENVKKFQKKCPEQYQGLIECAAFVNWRRIEQGEDPILVLSFYN